MHTISRISSSLAYRIRRFRSYGLNGLDRRVAKHLPKKDGFFVELGANDGVSTSNTLYLEKYRGWRGVLVEPIPELYRQCVKNRPKAKVFNCACVDGLDPSVTSAEMTYCNLMSIVNDAFQNEEDRKKWLEWGEKAQPGVRARRIVVPARTLASVLDDCGSPDIDFLSLDVEGYETQVLRGLQLERHRPKWILVETRLTPVETLLGQLGEDYEVVERFDGTDALLKQRKV